MAGSWTNVAKNVDFVSGVASRIWAMMPICFYFIYIYIYFICIKKGGIFFEQARCRASIAYIDTDCWNDGEVCGVQIQTVGALLVAPGPAAC